MQTIRTILIVVLLAMLAGCKAYRKHDAGVCNMLGQRVNIDVITESNRELVSLASMPAGVYFLSYSNGAS